MFVSNMFKKEAFLLKNNHLDMLEVAAFFIVVVLPLT